MTVGSYLQTVRKEKNLSVQDVSFALKISPKILVAIEENNEAELPAKAFVKGFVKSYAKLLKINSSDFDLLVIAEFGDTTVKKNLIPDTPKVNVLDPSLATPETTMAHATTPKTAARSATSAPEATAQQVEESLSSLNKKSSEKTVIYFALGICLLVLIIVTQRIVEKYQKESTVAAPTQEIVPIEEKATSSSAETNVSAEEAKAELKKEEAAAAEAVNKSEAPPATADTAAPLTKAPEKEVAETAPAAPTGAFKLSEVEVIVEANGAVEIQYSSKTSLVGRLNLSKGQVHIFKSKNGLQLTVTDGGLIKTAVNGQDKGVPGQNGKPITITY